jgi:3-oxoacyl-(acyl-carrier-protein) synthase
MSERIVITGMAVNTVLGDRLDGYLRALLAGQSGIGIWKRITAEAGGLPSPVGGDLSDYDIAAKLDALADLVPASVHNRLVKLSRRLPWSLQLSIVLAVEAWRDASAFGIEDIQDSASVIVAGHNLNHSYICSNLDAFRNEPLFIDGVYSIHEWDTAHAACVAEVLQIHGTAQTAGAACASGNYALRVAIDEVRHHGAPCALVLGAVTDLAPIDIQGFSLLGAISQDSFNDRPTLASRPFDVKREGFVPAHGLGALVIEPLTAALRRGARIYAEVLGVETSADASHLPNPSSIGQVLAMRRVLQRCHIAPQDVDYVNGHFTATPVGDVIEIAAIREVFGDHAYRLKMNATKSLIGHSLGSSAIVELVGAVLQMNAGMLHPTINIDELDPAIDVDVCRGGPQPCDVKIFMKNAFGFGGLNSSCLVRRWEG